MDIDMCVCVFQTHSLELKRPDWEFQLPHFCVLNQIKLNFIDFYLLIGIYKGNNGNNYCITLKSDIVLAWFIEHYHSSANAVYCD